MRQLWIGCCCAFLAACTTENIADIAARAAPAPRVVSIPGVPVQEQLLIDLGYVPLAAEPEAAESAVAAPTTAETAAGPTADVAVLRVQTMLEELGFDPGPLDGLMGPRTRAAIDAFHARAEMGGSTVDLATLETQLAAARLIPEAQEILAELGYEPGPVDGIGGPETTAAIRAFQARYALPVDGELTAVLVARLRTTGLTTEIQTRLAMLGHAPGPADGIAGPLTKAAIRAFQADQRLPRIGWATVSLRDRLREAPHIAGVQRMLTAIGYAPGRADGRVGPATRAAIRVFQGDTNLPVTGRPTPDVILMLREMSRASLIPASGTADAPEPPGVLHSLLPLAESGAPSAQHLVAGLYLRGLGMPADVDSALRWYGRAARQGFAPAQYRLGLMYAFGIGTSVDKAAAQGWLAQAADGGHEGATRSLNLLADNALQDMPVNSAEIE